MEIIVTRLAAQTGQPHGKKIMEAATLKKKNKVAKGKLKKTIKNVLCRPDPVYWPAVQDEQGKTLDTALNKYKISIPEYKKLHWKELQLIPKDKRPKPPKIRKVDGLLFGILECCSAVQHGECSAVIIESKVNPRTIVQHVIEACIGAKVPVVCLNDLRKLSTDYFGIPTCCLGLKTDCLKDLRDTIFEIAKFNKPQENKQIRMDTEEDIKIGKAENVEKQPISQFQYLFRSNKKTRVFNPSEGKGLKTKNAFTGQDFIELSDKSNQKQEDRQAYMKMIVKRITNNPNRMKIK